MSDYTSNLLCHFVGRSRPNEDERFDLLVNIIKGNQLIANLSEPDNPHSLFQGNYQCENVGEVFGKCDCVCFCDIPNEALSIHINKYSKFGFGFEKTFIANQGARPVMYVPQNFDIVERGDNKDKSNSSATPKEPNQYYPHLLKLSSYLLPLTELSLQAIDLGKIEEHFTTIGLKPWFDLFNTEIKTRFFSKEFHPMFFSLMQGINTQMAYMKLYDATLPDDHPDNYYMEREWRSLNNIEFSLNDIKTIYLPSEHYQTRFISEFPEYNGEFYLFDEEI